MLEVIFPTYAKIMPVAALFNIEHGTAVNNYAMPASFASKARRGAAYANTKNSAPSAFSKQKY